MLVQNALGTGGAMYPKCLSGNILNPLNRL
jgi:hypothetical protein